MDDCRHRRQSSRQYSPLHCHLVWMSYSLIQRQTPFPAGWPSPCLCHCCWTGCPQLVSDPLLPSQPQPALSWQLHPQELKTTPLALSHCQLYNAPATGVQLGICRIPGNRLPVNSVRCLEEALSSSGHDKMSIMTTASSLSSAIAVNRSSQGWGHNI